MITIFTETDKNNYVSIGSDGKTFVAEADSGGWMHGRISLDATSYPTDNPTTYRTPHEALRAASSKYGYKIDGNDSRGIGIALYSP